MIHKQGLIAAGLGYERFLDRPGMLSLTVSAYRYGTYFFSKVDGPVSTVSGFQGVCGLMYHPLGNRRMHDLSAGIAIGAGQHKRSVDSNNFPGRKGVSVEQGPLSAVLGQVSLTVQGNRKFVFGIHFSAGMLLQPADRERLIIQGGLKFGSRF
jgi:hypothetical protein